MSAHDVTKDSGAMRALAGATIGILVPRPHVRVEADTCLGEVVDQLRRAHRGAALVESDGVLVGIFTERDLLNRVDLSGSDWTQVAVSTVMTPYPMVIRRDDTLAEALRRLLEGRRRNLPIVDDRGAVLGLVSIRDILSYIASRFPQELVNLPPAPDHAGTDPRY